jgi:1-deoxy-D-xylulose-5-phosphate reductoisomerase
VKQEFEATDHQRIPHHRHAPQARQPRGTYPCSFNAANEVAVAAFLDRRIGFLDIARVVEDALEHVDGSPARDLEELVEADAGARERAREASPLRPSNGVVA